MEEALISDPGPHAGVFYAFRPSRLFLHIAGIYRAQERSLRCGIDIGVATSNIFMAFTLNGILQSAQGRVGPCDLLKPIKPTYTRFNFNSPKK